MTKGLVTNEGMHRLIAFDLLLNNNCIYLIIVLNFPKIYYEAVNLPLNAELLCMGHEVFLKTREAQN